MKHLSEIIRNDLSQFGYKYLPIEESIENLLLQKDNFVYVFKKDNKYDIKSTYCVNCHSFSETIKDSCFFCGKQNKISKCYNKPVFYTVEGRSFKYEKATIIPDYKNLVVMKDIIVMNKKYNDEVLIPFEIKNELIIIDFNENISSYEIINNKYCLYMNYSKEEFHLLKDDKIITLSDFAKENNIDSINSLTKWFDDKLFSIKSNLKNKTKFTGKYLLSHLLSNITPLFSNDIFEYDADLTKLQEFLSFYDKTSFSEEHFSHDAIKNIVASYHLKNVKTIHLKVLLDLKQNKSDKLNEYASKYKGSNLIFITHYLNKNLDESKLEGFLNIFTNFTSNKYLLVDLLEFYDIDVNTLKDYFDYLERYEALSDSKAIQAYVKYLTKNKKEEMKNIDLYPKDILIKL